MKSEILLPEEVTALRKEKEELEKECYKARITLNKLKAEKKEYGDETYDDLLKEKDHVRHDIENMVRRRQNIHPVQPMAISMNSTYQGGIL